MEKKYAAAQILNLIKRCFRKPYLGVILLILISWSNSAQTTYTFTSCGNTGSTAPTAAMASTAYASTNLNGSVTVGATGIQSWTVPATGAYRIEAYGAQGGGATANANTGGPGAIMRGDFNLTGGQVLSIVAGQAGTGGTSSGGGGGGGGGSGVMQGTTLLIAAGGGGGAGWGTNGVGGATTTTGATSTGTCVGGSSGAGGTAVASNGGGCGGGGLTGAGAKPAGGTPNTAGPGGFAAIGGALSNWCSGMSGAGGFGVGGGGGGEGQRGGSGGGGGYSGGGGGEWSNAGWCSTGSGLGAGGGGSYNNGTNVVNTASSNLGDGKVVIVKLCSITLTATGINANGAICSGSSVSLTTNAISNYSWSTGASTSSIIVSPTVTSTYTLTAMSPSLCTTDIAITITVNTGVPVLSVANTTSASGGICPTRTVNLNATGATTYSWVGGSTTVTNGVTFSPTVTSGYTVTGTNACGSTTAATSVSIHPFPTVTPVASTSSLCSGLTLTLTGVGNATAYAWSGGAGGITNGVGFSPALTATYTVIATSALSCTASATIPVTVVTTPNLAPTSNPGLVCIGKSSTLTATGATNYTWTSATQTVNTATFIVTPNLGTTIYTVTKANANCVDTKTISVVTNPLPTIFAIVTPTIVCALTSATLAVGGAQTYTWTSPGPPSYTFTGASPIVNPPVSTTYSVAASDGTCINTTTVFLAANPNPTITTTASTPTICMGQSVTVNANGGINYTWTASGSTNTFYTQSVAASPTIATAYNVLGDNSFGCITGATQIVLVYPNPTITIVASKTLVCNNGASTLTASGAQSFTWDANANGALTAGTVVHPANITSGPVIFTVQGTYTTTGCSSTKTTQVVVFIPTLSVSGNTNTCAGGLINLVAGGGMNNSYSWNTGSGTPYTFPSISSTIAAPTTWTVSANTSSASVICPSSFTVALALFYNPTITAVAQRTTICKTESVNLTGNGGVSYTWNNNMTGGTITVNPNTNTNYTVTGTDANGCSSTGTVQVKVSSCSGVNELSNGNAGLMVYPNPNNGEFIIESGSDITLTLVNELGQIVRTITMSAANNYKVLVTDLAKGIYFISGQKDHVLVNQKIIVTK